jgi:uncharacterized protein (AIM24 family)
MAEFTIRDVEGMRQLRIDLKDEMVRSVRGALSHMDGQIKMTAPIPGPGALLRALISREAAVRPRFRGTGSVFLEPSLKGYHVFEARDLKWILEPGVFWACEGDVRLGLRLERPITSMWAGDGLINYTTTIEGDGRVAINAPGPVEEIVLDDSEIVAQGRLVLARTAGLRYRVRRPAGFIQSLIAGEPIARCFSGTGRALVCWTPYWNQYMHDNFMGEGANPFESFRA